MDLQSFAADARTPGASTVLRLSRNTMASIAEFNLMPVASGTKILPGKRTFTFGTEMLRKRYETLSRLPGFMSVGTPEDWISGLSTDLRNTLPFDLLELVVYKNDGNDGNEVRWRSLAAGHTVAVKDVATEETVFGWVHHHQQPLWIADCETDEGCAVASQRRPGIPACSSAARQERVKNSSRARFMISARAGRMRLSP